MYYLFAHYPYVCMAIELGVVVCLVLLPQIEDLSNTYVDPTTDTAANSGAGFDAYSASVEAAAYFAFVGFTATECHPSGANHDELDEVRQLARVYDNPTSPVC